MPFEKVETQVDFPAQERQVLEFWAKIDAFNKLRAKNAGGKRWSFLDGPITANNPMGVHHAWGRTYKDAYQRYFAMTGHELRYQNGFDCQGLWVEVEVEKELKLASKRDIENLVPGDPFASIDRFVNECKARVNKFARVQTDQSIRLGYWMDWDRTDEDWAKSPDDRKSYFTMSEKNNYTIWNFLKKCHAKKYIYEGYDAMPWCARCGTGISQQEMNEGYKIVAHRSIFVKFPLVNALATDSRLNENLLAWTTTPWTLTSNVAAAVNPDLTYLKIKQGDQIYYVGKSAFKTARLEEQFKAKEWVEGVPKLKTLEQLFKEKSKDGFEIVGEVKGAELVGREYAGPFDEFEAQNTPFGYPAEIARVVEKQNWAPAITGKVAHRVVGWKDVGETEGTGIVHIAPGCGKEDFALGKEVGLPPVAPLDESGIYLPGFGPLSGKSATSPEVVEFVVNSLKEKGLLFATEMYPHKYPHCWRCKQELLYRLVDEWYIDMGPRPEIVGSDEVWKPGFRTEVKETVDKATFLPEELNGKARELDWLRNMGDWMISKKRYWGLALPIWVDHETGEFEVIGSREELKERAVEGWAEFEGHPPHRPWIDKIKIKSLKTGRVMTRVSDVGNPWLDAGIVAFSTMGFGESTTRNTECGIRNEGSLSSIPNSEIRTPNWEEWYPADFITESFPGQFRNWFYALLSMSTVMCQGTAQAGMPPFKTLLGHGMVRDQNGDEMHKSKGNSIEFNGAANDGYALFTQRKPKLSIEDQAKKELPAGFTKCAEDDAIIDGKPQKVVKGFYPPIGADVIRWMYCRTNPISNINMGPGPADELRAKFILKLWNTYAFFCNYARLDGFDPATLQVAVADRPDIDRWILSDLQLLIRKAHESFQSFNVMDFCLEAEKFIDDKLSNWYIRRNRRRFWKGEQGADKQAAYQTLYTVLTTFAKLIAPVVPFLAETMWQNLAGVSGQGSGVRLATMPEASSNPTMDRLTAMPTASPESVHHCDYPKGDATLIDQQLSERMAALLRLVSLGGALRSAAKVKTRQPLAEIKFETLAPVERLAIGQFAEQIRDELNVKVVTLNLERPAILREVLKLNMKTAGSKYGSNLRTVQSALEAMTLEQTEEFWKNGSIALSGDTIEKADVVPTYIAADGWIGLRDGLTLVALDTRITPALAAEGMARDIIRQVQDLRKNADLQMEDRIALYLGTEADSLKQAIEAHRSTIAAETLTQEWAAAPLAGIAHTATAKIDGQALTITLKKVSL